MKNLQILMMCCFLVLLTACGREGGTAQTPVASEEITESITQMPDEQESEAMPENMELGLTVNGVYYPIPISLKQLTDDGWKISGQTPYFLEPFVGEEYYETRADWSLSKDGQEILVTEYILTCYALMHKYTRVAICKMSIIIVFTWELPWPHGPEDSIYRLPIEIFV